jgi:hypothetical protein
VKGRKIIGKSQMLGRDFHLDFFGSAEATDLMVIMFGGSGVTKEEYLKRRFSVIPVFDAMLTELEREASFCFAYFSSPFDVNLNAVGISETETARWKHHAIDELLPELPELPFYFIGYSGGLSSALHSVHDHERCFGGGAIGGDNIPDEFSANGTWLEPLTLYYNISDGVYELNQPAISDLEFTETAQCFRKLSGTHALHDYIRNESLSGLCRRACRLWNRISSLK